jgi:hypothetical protein
VVGRDFYDTGERDTMTLKASRGLGIVAVYELVLCILLAA